ncbi:hypothetical protein AAC387_Pa12g0473 [Persea americana]
MHNKTPTEIRLQRLGFSLASRCSIYLAAEDSIGHLLFYCDLAISIWTWFLGAAGVHHPTRLSATSIWESISKENNSNGLQFMAALFITVLFYLWKARNEALFEARRPSMHLIQATLSATISFSLKSISKPFASPQIRTLCASLRIAISHGLVFGLS